MPNEPIYNRDGSPAWVPAQTEHNPFADTADQPEQGPVEETTQQGTDLDNLFADTPEQVSESTTSGLWVSRKSPLLDDEPPAETESEQFATFVATTDSSDQSLYQQEEQATDNSWSSVAGSAAQRYEAQEKLYSSVQDVLALAMSGDPAIQAVIKGFTLTRDKELDAKQRQDYALMLRTSLPEHGITIPNPDDYESVIDMAYDELLGIGPLGPLWRDDEVVDILVNGPFNISVERSGKLLRTPVKFLSAEHLQSTARRLSTLVDDRAVSRTNPIVTVQLPGARVQLVWEPIAYEGASVVIRKHRDQLKLEQLINAGALTNEMVAFLADAVLAKATILVSGATGSGKTTYLNVLSSFIPTSERVIVIEDAHELSLENDHVEYMLTKSAATADDTLEFGFDKLLRASLRMRPDRIVVGEILDAAGARAMLEAAFTGHDGTMTTLHANNPSDALVRIAGLLRQATGMPEDLSRQQVNSTFHLIVQVARDPSGKRLVTQVANVLDDGSTEVMFTGTVNTDQSTKFVKTAPLSHDSPLYRRMLAAGIDTGPWETL